MECTPPFVSLSSLYPSAWLCVSTQKRNTHTETTKHAFVTRCTRVVVVVVFSFKEHVHVYSARVGMCVAV